MDERPPQPVAIPISKSPEISLTDAILILAQKMEELAREMKSRNKIEEERLEFTRMKDILLANLTKTLRDEKKKKEA